MTKVLKRTSALLCVIVLLSSMLVVPASAANGSFYIKGRPQYVTESNGKGSYSFSFAGYGIDYVGCYCYDSGRPSVSYSIPKGGGWKPSGEKCSFIVNFTGGSCGTYQFDLVLGNNEMGIRWLDIRTIYVTVP